MRKLFLVFVFVVAIVCLSSFTSEAAKAKVAVLDFEFGTIADRWWPHDWDIGKGICDMMVTQLVKDGTYSVIERRKIEAVLNEQKFGASGLVNASTAAQIGKILGVKYVIIGSITQFSIENKDVGLGFITQKFGFGDAGVSNAVAAVYIDARMIDTTTAEIVAVGEGKAEESRSGVKLGGGSYKGFGGLSFGSSNFSSTILGQATRKSVVDVVKQLSGKGGDGGNTAEGSKSGGVVKTKVADTDVSTKSVYLTAGSGEGVTVGQVFNIQKVKKEIKDPETGDVIKKVVETIAEITITEVESKSSTGTIIKGDIRGIKAGDEASLSK